MYPNPLVRMRADGLFDGGGIALGFAQYRRRLTISRRFDSREDL